MLILQELSWGEVEGRFQVSSFKFKISSVCVILCTYFAVGTVPAAIT